MPAGRIPYGGRDPVLDYVKQGAQLILSLSASPYEWKNGSFVRRFILRSHTEPSGATDLCQSGGGYG